MHAQVSGNHVYSISPTVIYEGETLEFRLSYSRTFWDQYGSGTTEIYPNEDSTATEGHANDWYLTKSDGSRIGKLNLTTNPAPNVITGNNFYLDFRITANTDSSSEGDETIVLKTTEGYDYDGYFYGLGDIQTITITLKDGPRPSGGVTVSESSLALTELGTSSTIENTYTVVLVTNPAADVTITATSGDTSAAQVKAGSGSFANTATMTFTAGGDGSGSGAGNGNWAVAQTVTVRALNDGDAANESFNITHGATAASGPYNNISIDPVAVIVTDAGHGADVSASTVSVREDDDTATYQVVLKSQPSGNVTISTTSSMTAIATASPGSLPFTSSNWNTPQTVTVTGRGAGSASISHAVSSSADTTNYPTNTSIPAVSVTVTAAPGLLITETGGTTVSEDGTTVTDTYTIALKTMPSHDVTVSVSPGAGARVNTASFTFTSGSWNTAQTVTVTGVNDDIDNAGDARTAMIGHSTSSTDANYNITNAGTVSVTVTDDDDAGVTIAETGDDTTAGENGGTDTYTVVLDSQPLSNVVITVTSGDGGIVKVDGPDNATAFTNTETLTFTDSSWNSPQTVTVQGQDDNVHNQSARTAAISHAVTTADGGKYTAGLNIDSVEVTLTDDETAANPVNLSVSSSGAVTEGGSALTVTAALQSANTTGSALTIPIRVRTSGTTAQAGDYTVATSISIANNASSGTTTFTADQDTTDEPDETVIVEFGSPLPNGVPAGSNTSVTITITDDDATQVTLTTPDATADEGDSSDTAQITVTLGRGLVDGEALVVPLQFSGGVPGTDFTLACPNPLPTGVTCQNLSAASPQVTFTGPSSGTSAAAITLTLTASDDANHASETLDVAIPSSSTGNAPILTATNLDGGASGSRTGSGQITITDDDTAGIVISVGAAQNINEGASGTYTVRLATQPSASVTVTITGQSGTDLSVDTDAGTQNNQDTLTFTTTDWNQAQTVSIEAAEDDADAANDDVTLVHSASGGGYNGVSSQVVYTILDNDVPVSLSVSDSGAITEADSALTVTATLQSANSTGSALSIPIQVRASGTTAQAGDYSVASSISIANGQTAGTASFAVTNDSADEPDETVVVELGASLPSNVIPGSGTAVTITITDDDATTVTLTTPDATATEGDSSATAEITVTLGRGLVDGEALVVPLQFSGGVPGTDFTLACPNPLPTGVTCQNLSAASAQVTFTGPSSGMTATAVTLTLTAANDDDSFNDTVTVSIPSSSTGNAPILTATNLDGGASGSRTGSGQITITDDDTAGIVISVGATQNISEGATGSYTVRLATRPSASVTVTITGQSGTDLSVDTNTGTIGDQNTLTFTDTNWNQAQTVNVAAAEDNGDFTNDTVTLVHTASGGGYNGVTGQVAYTIVDNDTPQNPVNLSVSGSGAITEGGSALTVTATLQSANATGSALTIPIQVRASGTTAQAGDYTVATSISIANNASSGTTTFTADQDTTDEPDETVIVEFGSPLPNGVPAGSNTSVTITITDDDATQVTLTTPDATADEGASSDTAQITLTLGRGLVDGEALVVPLIFSGGTPGTDFTLACPSATGVTCQNLSAASAQVTFTGPSSGMTATAVTLTLTAANDDDSFNDTVTVSIPSSSTGNAPILTATNLDGGASGSRTGSGQITITDDDTAGIVISVGATQNISEGATGSYTVRLATRPSASVTVTITGQSGTDLSVDTNTGTIGDQNTLTFTDTNWNQAQTVNVAAAEDNGDFTNDTVTLVHTASGGGYNGVTGQVAYTIVDNDTPQNPVNLSVSGSGAITEGGSALTVTATLQSANATGSALTIPIQVRASGTTAQAGDYTVATSISIANNASSGTTTFTADQDTTDEPDETVIVEFGSPLPNGVPAGSNTSVTITITDDDATQVTLTTPDATADEGASSDTAQITLTLGRGLVDGEALVVPLIFSGGTPGTDFTLACPSATGVTCQNLSAASAQVTFTGPSSGMTATAVTLTLTAANDDDSFNDTVTVSIPSSSTGNAPILTATNLDGGASGSRTGSGQITITDDDTAGIVISVGATQNISEGATGSYTVRLATRPSASVTVTITGQSGTDLSVDTNTGTIGDQNTLTFTDTNWNQAQTVNVAAAEDNGDFTNDTVTLVHTASGGGYNGVTGQVAYTIVDNDTPQNPVNLSVSGSGAITEGGSALTVTATLQSANATGSALTIPIQVRASGTTAQAGDYTVATSISIANNASSGTTTFTADQDTTDEPDETVIVEFGSPLPNGVPAGSNTSVTITITDDDATQVTLTTPDATADEGASSDTAQITLTLGRGLVDGEALVVPLIFSGGTPGTDFTLACPSATGVTCQNLSAASAQVTFTGPSSGMTATAVTLTLTAANDDDSFNDTVTVSIPSSSTGNAPILTATNLDGGASGSRTGSGQITITDDDTAGIVISVGATQNISEGATGSYTVRLATRPSASVTVTITGQSGTDLSVDTNTGTIGDQNTLTFTDTNWNQAQTVNVAAAEDNGDFTNDTVTLVHTASGGGYNGVTGQVAYTIVDNDTPQNPVNLSVSGSGAITEGGSALTVTATLQSANATGSALTIPIQVRASGTTAQAGDYTVATSITIANNAASGTTSFSVTNDATDEPDETVIIELGSPLPNGVPAGSGTSVTITITDNDATQVTLAGPSGNVTEGDSKTFTITLGRALASGETLAVPLTFAGTATRGADYTLTETAAFRVTYANLNSGSARVTFAGGSGSAAQATITLSAAADSTSESSGETVNIGMGAITAQGLDGGTAKTDNFGQFRIVDAPISAVTLSLAAGAARIDESGSGNRTDVTLTLGRALAASETVTVPLTVTGATVTTHYALGLKSGASNTGVSLVTSNPHSAQNLAVVLSGAGARTAVLELEAADNTDTATRTVNIAYGTGTRRPTIAPAGSLTLSGSPKAVTIDNDDTAQGVSVSFAEASSRVNENAGTHNVKISLSPAPSAAISLTYTVGGSAVSGDDFTISNSGTLAVSAGTSGVSVPVTIIDNFRDEPDRQVILELQSASGYQVGAAASHTLTITDNDTAGLALSPSNVRINPEGVTHYSVRLRSEPSASVTVRIRVVEQRDESGSVVTVSPQTLHFDADNWNTAQQVEITAQGLGTATLEHEIITTDSNYSQLTAPAAVRVSVQDQSPEHASAWFARFGRTVGEQVVDAVTSRLVRAKNDAQSTSLRIAGQSFDAGQTRDALFDHPHPDRSPAPDRRHSERHESGLEKLTGQIFLSGTSFDFSQNTAAGSRQSVWGRGAISDFDGRSGAADIEGTASSVLMGADDTAESAAIGLAFSHSLGKGKYRDDSGEGRFRSDLTGLYVYGRQEAEGGITLWGVGGYGIGDYERRQGDSVWKSDIAMQMAAGGIRAPLPEIGLNAVDLHVTGDLLWVKTKSEGEDGDASATVSRYRAGIEGEWPGLSVGGGTLVPGVQLSLRRDSGDAETGFGAGIEAGFVWRHPDRHLEGGMRASGLITHENHDLRQFGLSGSLSWDPKPGTERGASMALETGLDGAAEFDELMGGGAADGASQPQQALQRHWQLRFGYGFGTRYGVSIPEMRIGVQSDRRDYTLGWRLAPERSRLFDYEIRLQARRRETDDRAPQSGVGLEFRTRW